MKVGVKLMAHPIDVETILARATLAESLGYDSVWLSDHMMWPKLEGPRHATVDCWTTMTAVGAITQHVQLGYSMLNLAFRPPAVLAKMVATLDHITKGRVLFSIGAGGYQPEYQGYDLRYLEGHAAQSAFEREVAQLCKLLWTTDTWPVSFEGTYTHLKDCYFYPPPYQKPHPPIWFGGNSAYTRALVRDLGDGWLMHLKGAKQGIAQLQEDGWPDRPITLASNAQCAVGSSRAEAINKVRRVAVDSLTQDVNTLVEWAVLGTPEACVERLQELESWGLSHVFLTFDGDESLEWFGREALPRVQGRVGGALEV